MKHLLIILSFLLLSSPLFGHPKGVHTFYRWKNPSGDGWVWKGFGDKETQPVYKGEVENGVPNGLGILYDLDGSKYVGSWKNGKKNRQGTFTYPNGEKYEGEWKDGGLWNGTGYDKNGNITYKYEDGRMDKTINPLSKRKIKQNGPMFKKIHKLYDERINTVEVSPSKEKKFFRFH